MFAGSRIFGLVVASLVSGIVCAGSLSSAPPDSLLNSNLKYATHYGTPVERKLTVKQFVDSIKVIGAPTVSDEWEGVGQSMWIWRVRKNDPVNRKQMEMAFVFSSGVIGRVNVDGNDILDGGQILVVMDNFLAMIEAGGGVKSAGSPSNSIVSDKETKILAKNVAYQNKPFDLTLGDLIDRIKKDGKFISSKYLDSWNALKLEVKVKDDVAAFTFKEEPFCVQGNPRETCASIYGVSLNSGTTESAAKAKLLIDKYLTSKPSGVAH